MPAILGQSLNLLIFHLLTRLKISFVILQIVWLKMKLILEILDTEHHKTHTNHDDQVLQYSLQKFHMTFFQQISHDGQSDKQDFPYQVLIKIVL